MRYPLEAPTPVVHTAAVAGVDAAKHPVLCGVFVPDPDQPVVNGKPHYKTAAGGHQGRHVRIQDRARRDISSTQ